MIFKIFKGPSQKKLMKVNLFSSHQEHFKAHHQDTLVHVNQTYDLRHVFLKKLL